MNIQRRQKHRQARRIITPTKEKNEEQTETMCKYVNINDYYIVICHMNDTCRRLLVRYKGQSRPSKRGDQRSIDGKTQIKGK